MGLSTVAVYTEPDTARRMSPRPTRESVYRAPTGT